MKPQISTQAREIRALTRGVLANFHLVVWIVLTGAAALFSIAALAPLTISLSRTTAITAVILALMLITGIASIAKVQRRYIYPQFMVMCAASALGASIATASALFGPGRDQLAHFNLPYVSLYIPIVVLFAHTFLIQTMAIRLSWVLVALLVPQVAVYAWWNREIIADWTGIVLFLGFCSLLPIHMAILVRVHLRIQSSMVHLNRVHQRQIVAENHRLRQQERRDPISQGLNDLGVRDALLDAFRAGHRVSLVVAKIKDYERLQRRLSAAEEERFLRRLAAIFADALQPQTPWGMNPERQFLLWTTQLSPSEFETAVESLKQRLVPALLSAKLRCELHLGTAISNADLEGNPELAPALLIHDAELSLFKSMIGGFVSDKS